MITEAIRFIPIILNGTHCIINHCDMKLFLNSDPVPIITLNFGQDTIPTSSVLLLCRNSSIHSYPTILSNGSKIWKDSVSIRYAHLILYA